MSYYNKRDLQDAFWFLLVMIALYLNLVIWSI